MNEIIQLSRLARDSARAWKRRTRWAKWATLGLALLAVFLKDITKLLNVPDMVPVLELTIALVSLVLTLSFIGCSLASRHFHLLAREGMRRGLLIDAFGSTKEPLDMANLQASLSKLRKATAPATDVQEPYYASQQPPGDQRFREHLQESAFFSAALFSATAKRSLLMLVLPSIIILVLSVAHPAFAGPASFSVSRCLILLFVSFVTSDSVAECILLFSAAHKAGNVDRRLEHADLTSREVMLAVFADYSVATALAPTLPQSVYLSLRGRLTSEWATRRGASTPVVPAGIDT